MKTSFLRNLALFSCGAFFGTAMASNHLNLPPKQIHYICSCKKPSDQGICGVSVTEDGSTQSGPALANIKHLKGGWEVRLLNCISQKKYVLTAGAQLFAGKKIKALYDNIGLPMAASGYVYHVHPNMPFTKNNYSITVVSNPAIKGIKLNTKGAGWQCGLGNRQVSCHQKFHSARCFVGGVCHFQYKK